MVRCRTPRHRINCQRRWRRPLVALRRRWFMRSCRPNTKYKFALAECGNACAVLCSLSPREPTTLHAFGFASGLQIPKDIAAGRCGNDNPFVKLDFYCAMFYCRSRAFVALRCDVNTLTARTNRKGPTGQKTQTYTQYELEKILYSYLYIKMGAWINIPTIRQQRWRRRERSRFSLFWFSNCRHNCFREPLWEREVNIIPLDVMVGTTVLPGKCTRTFDNGTRVHRRMQTIVGNQMYT